MTKITERRVPTPVVLAIASGMLCVGVVAVIVSRGESEPEVEDWRRAPSDMTIDTRTPEATAETFLDAWRRREHGVAAHISIGQAHEAVLARQRDDESLDSEEHDIKEQVWDEMAAERLHLFISESETRGEKQVTLRGTARGEFLGRPYEREIEFVVERVAGEWKVERMGLGEILSETPDFLDVRPEPGDTPSPREPGQLEYRGEDVP